MIRSIITIAGQLLRKNFPLLFSVLGHALVITVALIVWRSFMAGFEPLPESREQIFEIEIVSPAELEAAVATAKISDLKR